MQIRDFKIKMGKTVGSVYQYFDTTFMGFISNFFYRKYLAIPVYDMGDVNHFCFCRKSFHILLTK